MTSFHAIKDSTKNMAVTGNVYATNVILAVLHCDPKRSPSMISTRRRETLKQARFLTAILCSTNQLSWNLKLIFSLADHFVADSVGKDLRGLQRWTHICWYTVIHGRTHVNIVVNDFTRNPTWRNTHIYIRVSKESHRPLLAIELKNDNTRKLLIINTYFRTRFSKMIVFKSLQPVFYIFSNYF